MKFKLVAVLGYILLAGCAADGQADRACEVFSPAEVAVPTTQNDQRVETNATGDPTGSSASQDCR